MRLTLLILTLFFATAVRADSINGMPDSLQVAYGYTCTTACEFTADWTVHFEDGIFTGSWFELVGFGEVFPGIPGGSYPGDTFSSINTISELTWACQDGETEFACDKRYLASSVMRTEAIPPRTCPSIR